VNLEQPFLGPVGRCIYCGATKVPLSREHTLPKSLGGGGTLVLQKASCQACSAITSKFERHVCSELLSAVRAKHKLPTKHKDRRPTQLPLSVQRGKAREIINIPIGDYPALVPLLLFAPPAHIDKRSYGNGISIVGCTLSGPPLKEIRNKLDMDGFTVTVTFKGVDLARLIAKIAYGFAIRAFGPDIIDTAYVRSAILNQIDDVGRWVGCVSQQPPPRTSNIHEMKLSVTNGDIYVCVRLFGNYETPEYLVVAGRAP